MVSGKACCSSLAARTRRSGGPQPQPCMAVNPPHPRSPPAKSRSSCRSPRPKRQHPGGQPAPSPCRCWCKRVCWPLAVAWCRWTTRAPRSGPTSPRTASWPGRVRCLQLAGREPGHPGLVGQGMAGIRLPAQHTHLGLAHSPAVGGALPAGRVFNSPSAFSLYVKRQIVPTRKADDGWKTVKYAGRWAATHKESQAAAAAVRVPGVSPPCRLPARKMERRRDPALPPPCAQCLRLVLQLPPQVPGGLQGAAASAQAGRGCRRGRARTLIGGAHCGSGGGKRGARQQPGWLQWWGRHPQQAPASGRCVH